MVVEGQVVETRGKSGTSRSTVVQMKLEVVQGGSLAYNRKSGGELAEV